MSQYRYTNQEGETIEKIYQAKEAGIHASAMDPGGFIYSVRALADTILGAGIPYSTVRLTNHYQPHIHSEIAHAARVVTLRGCLLGYRLALDAALYFAEK